MQTYTHITALGGRQACNMQVKYFIVLFIYFDKFNFYAVALFMFLTLERRSRNLDWEMFEKFEKKQYTGYLDRGRD